MHEMLTVVTDVRGVCLSVCLSRGTSRLHCAKIAQQIKMLLVVNTPGGPWNIVLDMSPDSHREGKGAHFEILGPPYISETAEARDWGPNKNNAKVGHTGSGLCHMT